MDGKRRIRIQAHLSYDDTAGRTLAQNHRDKQKIRQGTQETIGPLKISVLLAWGARSNNLLLYKKTWNNNRML